ncbi:hypothetical protein Fleli_0270 [Bernardetia litoralis DSM 6794]|uniref:Uncharacterized protein n=1 Tax=Bernardetia litoralis (strain ATCC 23117 / DSM 6794 / NBRC 15988 / NCIMB 1366 / Fx l1 / Sio-4) TaxID=880071 RepID=I4AFM4_BERLS|nr:hypothetical protein [Bernardetia litoralis]AFM02759.1 hypothetical protein Fleli_0270 [Bernardetia litoralis DSM 6794]
MKKGQIYKLISFNGKTESGRNCKPKENYWKLIGMDGTIINFSKELNFGDEDRVLFKFSQDILKQQLECHNTIPNALWILKTDLK